MPSNPASKPFSASSDNNKTPILAALRDVLGDAQRVLELGSGTGQHAVHFGAALPGLHWQTSDLPANHAGIHAWLEEAALPNVAPPLTLDVNRQPWPVDAAGPFDAAYSANTAHIMDWPSVEAMFAGVSEVFSRLPAGAGVFALYGPFAYHGEHTSQGNRDFDRQLRSGGGGMGIRDIDDITALAVRVGLHLADDLTMPVNNRLLVLKPGA